MTAKRSVLIQLFALAVAIAMTMCALPFLRRPLAFSLAGTDALVPPALPMASGPLLILSGVAASFWLAHRGPSAKPTILAFGVLGTLVVFEHGFALGSALLGLFSVRPMIALAFGFFAGISPIVAKVDQNPWFGVRTPWTLGSGRVWRATHRATARLWLVGGIVGSALTMFGAPLGLVFLFLVALVLAPGAISYRVWQKLGRP